MKLFSSTDLHIKTKEKSHQTVVIEKREVKKEIMKIIATLKVFGTYFLIDENYMAEND